MKLKKIASLMLAGVMAASMLAGCDTNSVKPEDPENPNIPVVTDGVSADVAARIKANNVDVPEYVTFADDADLDEALTYAVQYAGAKEVADGYINVVGQLQPVFNRNINEELEEAVGVTTNLGVKDTIDLIGDNDTLVNVEADAGQKKNLPDAVAVKTFVVSGEIEDMARNEMIADAIQGVVSQYQYTVTNNNEWGQEPGDPDNFTGGNFVFDYEVSISTCEADANSVIWGDLFGFQGVENPDVTFVAVQVVRTSTHQ